MRLVKLHFRTAVLGSMVLAGCACQSAQKPVSLLPPGSAPSLSAVAQAKADGSAVAQGPQAKQDSSQKARPGSAASAQASAQDSSQASSQANPTPATADPVGDLVARVEKEYQAGVVNYQAGNTDAAKKNFDNAFNALLGSNLDVRSDDRLQKEFDRIVAGVDELGLDGLGGNPGDAGNNAGADAEDQQKSEPAPIDETNGITPSADASVRAKAQAEIKSTHSDLPLMMTDQVAGYISYFSNRGRGNFERAFARSGRYHDMMVSILKEEGVPQDLIYLAQAESGFHPLAVSRVGARGIWQFMASRARGYGLSHNMWVDDRQDPEKSTRAAAHHLKDLYNEFGDWYLAMAAYNSGPGTVQSAVKRTGFADFWELYRRNVLPKETRNYVPIILAVTIMAKNPSQYGLNDVAMEHPADFDTVTLTAPVDLRLVAECVGGSVEDLQDLNPSLLRLTTPREGKFELHLPAGTKDQYETAMAAIPAGMRLWWRYHTVHSGDTLASLARTYHVTVKSIAEANHLDTPVELEADAKLVIPVAPGKHPLSDTATYARRITRYKVHSGDTVQTVAENFGVSPLMVRRWNGLRGESLSGRRVLALHLPITPSAHATEVASTRTTKKRTAKPATQTASDKPPVTKSAKIERVETAPAPVIHHKVRTGETLYSIATAYRTTVAALKRDNRNVAVLRPGMILTVQQR
ncbi:MAG: transglycosylase SLT domain-containing protein [Candidatus Sulfotelmatobacter sp.]